MSTPNEKMPFQSATTAKAPSQGSDQTSLARTAVNTLEPRAPELIFEAYVFDHASARVGMEYDVAQPKVAPTDWLAPIAEAIQRGESGNGSLVVGAKGKFRTKPVGSKEYQQPSKQFVQVTQFRLQVMKKIREYDEALSGHGTKSQTPAAVNAENNLAYRDSFHPTELQFLAYRVYTRKSEYEADLKAEKSNKGGTAGEKEHPEYRANKLLIFWDLKEKAVTRYALDGEETKVRPV